MSPRPAEWLNETFEHFNNSLEDALKKQFDEEAFKPSPDYEKLAKIGYIISNPELLEELQAAEEKYLEMMSIVFALHGAVNTDIPSIKRSKDEIQSEELINEISRAIPPTPILPSGQEAQVPSLDKKKYEISVFDEILNNFIAKKDYTPVAMIDTVRGIQTTEKKNAFFEEALTKLVEARCKDGISQHSYDRKLKFLLALDDSKGSNHQANYDTVLNILDMWSNDDNPRKNKLSKEFYSQVSMATLEEILDKPDLEICSAERMAIHIRNTASAVKISFSQENWGENGEQIEITYFNEIVNELEDLLEMALYRGGEEAEFMEDLINSLKGGGYLGKNPEKLYVQEKIIELARSGSDIATSFLQHAWLDNQI
jgi:hypothetical protein